MEILDESSSINSDKYNSSDDSDFDMYGDSRNEIESFDNDKTPGVDEQNIRSYKSTDNDPIYDSYNMFTGTHVIKCMELGIYSPIMTTGKVSKNQRIVLNNQGSVWNDDSLAKAIRHAHFII